MIERHRDLMSSSSTSPHVILFPFMSKGHTIPLLHLAKLIHRHRPLATFTVFTTTANRPFISDSLSSALPSHLLSIISLPFPSHPSIPPGVESTDRLPSMSLLPSFLEAVEGLQPLFESALRDLNNHQNATTFLVSDGFLHWTYESSCRFGIPRLVFYGMSSFVHAICMVLGQNRSLVGPTIGNDELIQFPDFPWIRVTKNDFEPVFTDPEPKGPHFEFIVKTGIASSKSYALLVNSFCEIESKFLDYLNAKSKPEAWPIGPLCLAEKPVSYDASSSTKPNWIEWLDKKRVEGKPVLYVAFGSQAEISDEQLKEIAIGLEDSQVDFLWALRIKLNQEEVIKGFEENVKEKGLIVRGWLGQREVLEHESVRGFLSHCGWNSVIESICAGVPILAWPMMAEQHLNTRMVVDVIKIGLRVETSDGSVRGFVNSKGLTKMVKELMMGAEEVCERVKELSEIAKKNVEKGGKSWCNLELLLNELEAMPNMDCKSNGNDS